jgi:threonyl-tRNA synthetase
VALRRLGSDGQQILDLMAAANLLAREADPPDLAAKARGGGSPPAKVGSRKVAEEAG